MAAHPIRPTDISSAIYGPPLNIDARVAYVNRELARPWSALERAGGRSIMLGHAGSVSAAECNAVADAFRDARWRVKVLNVADATILFQPEPPADLDL